MYKKDVAKIDIPTRQLLALTIQDSKRSNTNKRIGIKLFFYGHYLDHMGTFRINHNPFRKYTQWLVLRPKSGTSFLLKFFAYDILAECWCFCSILPPYGRFKVPLSRRSYLSLNETTRVLDMALFSQYLDFFNRMFLFLVN